MRFGKGDKVVIEIKDVAFDFTSPVYVAGKGAFGEVVPLDEVAEPLSKYEEPLKAEINVKENEIVRLLKENEDLRVKYEALSESLDEFKKRVNDMCEVATEQGRIKGQEEAWELAQKIVLDEEDGGYSANELGKIFDHQYLRNVFNLTYSEVVAKVEAWEKAKEEIKVGDVIRSKTNDIEMCVLGYVNPSWINGVDKYGNLYFGRSVEDYKKTGKHIDVVNMLSQIGEDDA